MNKQELHLLVQNKCHRVPLSDTIGELKNPTGILAEEYSRIMKEQEEFCDRQKKYHPAYYARKVIDMLYNILKI